MREFCLEAGQFPLSGAHVVELVEKQGVHVAARNLAFVAEVDDAGDLDQSQTGSLGSADELQAGDGRVVVVAVAVGATSWCGEEALALVEPDGLAGQADAVGNLSYTHALHPIP